MDSGVTAQASSELIQLDVLNCTDGDTKLTFDPNNPIEVDKAQRVIADMLHRGYSLFVEVEPGKTKRVMEFDPTRGEYLVSWGPSDGEAPAPEKKPGEPEVITPKHRLRVKAAGKKATGVGMTAGG